MNHARLSPLPRLAGALVAGFMLAGSLQAQTLELADRPVRTSLQVPSNTLLSLSVEWPTGNVQAFNDERVNGCQGRDGGFSVCYMDPGRRAAEANAANVGNPNWRVRSSMPYQGYFDPWSCYAYVVDEPSGGPSRSRFEPVGRSSGYDATRAGDAQAATARAFCDGVSSGGTGTWSGNFLNWATMHTIDIFRWAMTGGDRAIDTTSMTVLEKARHDGTGGTDQFPIKRINGMALYGGVTPRNVSPYAVAELYLRVHGLQSAAGRAQFRVSDQSGFPANRSIDFNAMVRVCLPGATLAESFTTCTPYKAGGPDANNDGIVDADAILKPTGIIQENALVTRFSAFGYLLDDATTRDGGVMRARMKFVGPQQPARNSSGTIANAAAEWDPNTGIYVVNPDAADAAATNSANGLTGAGAVQRSGVIQYLNRFGRASGYKNNDPVSELYYEGLRYYRGLQPTTDAVRMSATGGDTVRKVDGFPVITAWDDPLAPPAGYASSTLDEWCPKNFVVGIADANAHKDKRLPGNTDTRQEVAATPAYPDAGDSLLNVSTWLTRLIAHEQRNESVTLLNSGGGNLTTGSVNCCDGSAYVAAMAYWANVSDIRPDGAALQTRGKQTVQTFFVDVRENGSWGTGVARTDPRRRNQLWLAAKYGGFTDLNGPADHTQPGELDAGDAISDDNRDTQLNVRDAWDRNGDNLPDTYYEAGSPEELVEGLRDAFNTIRSRAASAVGVGVSTRAVELTTTDGIYRVSYDPRNWSGSVVGLRYRGFDAASGSIQTDPVWDAAARLPLQNWSTGRFIATRRTDTGAAVPFRWASLSTAQQSALGGSAVLEWLRGRNDDATLRLRTRVDDLGNVLPAVLGDVVDAEPRYVGPPQAPLSDAANPGYGAFRTARALRPPMLYVAANDGMLHAFDADVSAGGAGGTERFAYVPSLLYAGPSSPATPEVNGLRALSSPNYDHRYYVNATPMAADVDFAFTGSTPPNPAAAGYTPNWGTLLVGGLGKGGRGFYALDITDPTGIASDTQAASRARWEFTDADMGFSYGLPQIVRTRRWGWVVLLTSGLQPARTPTGGTAFLYVVNAATGALLQKIAVPAVTGDPAGSSGLVQVTAYAPDAADGTVTEVYGGDQNGNVWRFDFTSATANVPAPVHFARLRDAAGNAQPISTGPVVRVAPLTLNRYVFVGTGRLYGATDLFDDRVQTFYALRDGGRRGVWTSANAPSGLTLPIERAEMITQTDLLQPIARNPARPGGWFVDLSAGGERVIVDPQDTDFGKISWLGSIPDANNPCVPTGGSRLYAASFETGQSQLFNPERLAANDFQRVTSLDPRTGAVGLRLVRVDGNIRAVVTGQFNELKLTQGYFRYLDPRSLNWREITSPGR